MMVDNKNDLALRNCLINLAHYEQTVTGSTFSAQQVVERLAYLSERESRVSADRFQSLIRSKAFTIWAVVATVLIGLWLVNVATGTNGDNGFWPAGVVVPWGLGVVVWHLIRTPKSPVS